MILGLPRPAILAISATGPNSSKLHHPALPLSLEELSACARACHMAGASLYHLLIRDDKGQPTLEPRRISEGLAHMEESCEGQLPMQLHLPKPQDASAKEAFALQRQAIETAQPKALSMAFRDLFPQGADEERELEARDFLDDCTSEGIAVQLSLDHIADLDWFYAYRQYGLLTIEKPMIHLDLTEAASQGQANAQALRPFLNKLDQLNLLSQVHWSVSAKGSAELPTAAAALAFGGHCQIGFAHNLYNADGELANDNAAQLAPVIQIAQTLGRPAASSFETLALLRG